MCFPAVFLSFCNKSLPNEWNSNIFCGMYGFPMEKLFFCDSSLTFLFPFSFFLFPFSFFYSGGLPVPSGEFCYVFFIFFYVFVANYCQMNEITIFSVEWMKWQYFSVECMVFLRKSYVFVFPHRLSFFLFPFSFFLFPILAGCRSRQERFAMFSLCFSMFL